MRTSLILCISVLLSLIPVAPAADPITSYHTVAGNDWTRYKTTADLRAAKLFWWFNKAQDANEQVDLVPDPTFGQVVRINFPVSDKQPAGAPRMLTYLKPPLETMWFRWRIKFTPGWTTVGPEPQNSANSYKMAFWMWEGFDGRADVELTNTSQYQAHWGVTKDGKHLRYEQTDLPGSQNFGRVKNEWSDGEWYEFIVFYEKLSPTLARQHWWRRQLTDKGKIVDHDFLYHGIEIKGDPIPRVNAVELGANKNKVTPEPMSLMWGPWEVVDGSKFEDPFGVRNPQPSSRPKRSGVETPRKPD
jgi:hypothetical protein